MGSCVGSCRWYTEMQAQISGLQAELENRIEHLDDILHKQQQMLVRMLLKKREDQENEFRAYLLGITFIVVTDCNALKATSEKKQILPRIAS
ncbi:hypothetical protein QE152_g38719 [Popillia japonica]|uniref:Uncharacterized protein n=1 Tax=Popillia japonica TaxID=7064 RepID=A0AAW1HVZ1_POPJA